MEKERSPDFSSVDVVFVNGHASVHWFMFESMFLIFAFRADLCPTMQSKDGETALDLARSEGKDDVVKLLEAAAEKKKAVEQKWSCECCGVRNFALLMHLHRYSLKFSLSARMQHHRFSWLLFLLPVASP
jgi:hypothetical protein